MTRQRLWCLLRRRHSAHARVQDAPESADLVCMYCGQTVVVYHPGWKALEP